MDNINEIKEKEDSFSQNIEGTIIIENYLILQKIGGGTFGHIYTSKNTLENKIYAVKIENKKNKFELLKNESNIMQYLKSPYLPEIKKYGETNNYNLLVMELMGKSLYDILKTNLDETGTKMSIRCVCNLTIQMLEILEFIHGKNIIHRDIKPDNFVCGLNHKSKQIFLIDFGLARKYRDETTSKHYQLIKKHTFTGTARFASINALNGITQSRRDDLESLGYVIIYLIKGMLPWQNAKVKHIEDKNKYILNKKIETTPELLCKDCPKEFDDYIRYTRSLKYEDQPDYGYLKNLFYSVLNKMGYIFDYFNDWGTGDNSTLYSSFSDNKNIHAINEEENNNKELEDKTFEYSSEEIYKNENKNKNVQSKKVDSICCLIY